MYGGYYGYGYYFDPTYFLVLIRTGVMPWGQCAGEFHHAKATVGRNMKEEELQAGFKVFSIEKASITLQIECLNANDDVITIPR